MERWVGEVAVVTGASSGIGAVIAEKLVKEGLKVVGLARRKEKLDEISKKLEGEKGKLYAVKADISKEDEVVAAFKWIKDNLGPVHILVNNAGFSRNTDLIDGDSQKWREVFETNVLGLCVATREAVRSMKESSIDGHIVHINSVAGHRIPNFPRMNVYPASKFAVRALAETLRHEINNNGLKIKITNLSPGAVETEFIDAGGYGNSSIDYSLIPFLKAEDIADGVLYVLGTPPHVLVQELTIMPVGQVI